MRIFWAITCGAALTFAIAACGSDNLGSGGDEDAGAECDDSADAGFVECAEAPTSCNDFADEAASIYGCCHGNSVWYCDDNFILAGGSCANLTCCFDPDMEYMNCI